MQRCLDLARLGAGHTAPNPMVGAVLVYEDRIIGEGYHERYGQAHAEVNCVRSVRSLDLPLIPLSTLYVSLEPCAHFGKTPPCADLVIDEKIPRVVVGCRDPFPQVNGKGIEKLRKAGVEVEVGVLEGACVELNKRFFLFNTRFRPYIVLKWAQSADGKIAGVAGAGGGAPGDDMAGRGTAEQGLAPVQGLVPVQGTGAAPGGGRTLISNEYSNRLVHKWRSEEASILVGTNTALADDPSLTVRLWNGPDPVRLIIDKELRLPAHLHLFDQTVRTIVLNRVRQEEKGKVLYHQLTGEGSFIRQVVAALYELKILSVLVEGGAQLLQSFVDEGYWDEARIITNEELQIPGGLEAPELKNARPGKHERIFGDRIGYYYNQAAL